MIFHKKVKEYVMMTEECPNCRQLTNTSFSRLVKDSCGHTKCRMCLLYEEHGCKICQAERCAQSTQDYESCSTNQDPNDANKTSSEEIVLPLELVINKNSKSKENCYDPISVESRLDIHYKNVNFDNNERLRESDTDNSIHKGPDKLYISNIESHNLAQNIDSHLKNENKSVGSQKLHDNQAKERLSLRKRKEHKKEASGKSKNGKCRDRSHITIMPGTPERYKCNVCSKTFRNKKGKCYHDACVTGVRPYQCTLCDRSFVKRSHFEYHERVHSGYKPYKCNLCDKAFPQQNKLNRHMFSHSKEKQFICPECNKRYSKRDDLKNHLSIHNATTTYTCKFCDKSFRILTNLKRHMRTHTSERSHICDQCNKSFKDKSLLIRHKRIHGKERPFSCAHCNRVFLSKSELRRHLTVHSDEKPFACEYCQILFRRKDNLNRHIRHHHSEDSSSEVGRMQIEEDKGVTKNNQQRQKQKPKKTLSKSPNKVPTVFVNSHDQINSRLDSMGNITPVIRTTNEVSNAVPVINGPISIRRLEDKTDKKMFTYTEPIPIADAVVINCRIEEKLYPQSASSHNYFVRSCLKDRNPRVNSYPGDNKITSQENLNHDASSTRTEMIYERTTTENQQNSTADICEEKSAECDERRNNRDKKETRKINGQVHNEESGCKDYKKNLCITSLRDEQSNCVPTITRHGVEQSEENSNKSSISCDNTETTNYVTLPKERQDNCRRKQSDVHWRRRTAEIFKPNR